MAVNLKAPDFLLPVEGVRLGVAEAAIKKPGRNDVLVVELAAGTQVAGVFTKNAFAAAPVQLCRQRLRGTSAIRGLLFNSGNANAATGPGGLADALRTTADLAQALRCKPNQVLAFSTGVIGQRLPVNRMSPAIARAAADLRAGGWLDAARAIMTTDTVPKGASRRVRTSAGEVAVTGIAKGVGMVCPNMATMLSLVATDARLTAAAVKRCIRDAAAATFNCASVDGDTSTNDSFVLAATGRAGAPAISPSHRDYRAVAQAVTEVCRELAQALVRDGEGATRFVEIRVEGARTAREARQVADAVAHSPLVKTALFAGDANWGRIVMAIGNAGVAVDPRRVGIRLDDVEVVRHGQPHPDYREERGAAVLAKAEYAIAIELGRGKAAARVWTCDLSYDYVKINAEYRT
jgi:glutamate N-acetyltransferase/amino-acid N-acetyltransferase